MNQVAITMYGLRLLIIIALSMRHCSEGMIEMAKARPITETEFRRVMAYAGTTRYPARNRLLLALSGLAGMRVGEIQGLDLIDVLDTQEGRTRDRIYLSAERTKWHHAREVYLNRTVQRLLDAHLQERGWDEGPLILSQSKRRFGRSVLVNLFRDLYRKAGIETSSHAGRALFITSLADRGVSIRIIQKAVGHRSLAATNSYLHARPEEIRAAVDLLR